MSSPKVLVKKSGFKSDMKQLVLLVWKNYCLQKRSIISTMFEIFIPALFAIILLPIRTIVKSQQFTNDTAYEPFSFNKFPANLIPKTQSLLAYSSFSLLFPPGIDLSSLAYADVNKSKWDYAYSPNNNSFVTEIMSEVALKLDLNLKGY
jgi:hypothetical protein